MMFRDSCLRVPSVKECGLTYRDTQVKGNWRGSGNGFCLRTISVKDTQSVTWGEVADGVVLYDVGGVK